MIKQIIKANKSRVTAPIPEGVPFLNVSEFFFDTIQGEGVNTGCPAAFLRLQNCTMNCFWCDTASVWRHGNAFSIKDLLTMIQDSGLVYKLKFGMHLVLTGGSPLLQQEMLQIFLIQFEMTFSFLPYLEIENECVIMPSAYMQNEITCWNNSPKLSNSGNWKGLRYNPEVLQALSKLRNSWFKFVVKDEKDVQEIEKDFVQTNYISKSQIILMPQGGDRKELEENRDYVVSLAVENNFRYCTREHVVLWDKMTGV